MSGFFLMHRGWRENPIFRGEFSRADAWVWMIENAAWKKTRTRIKGDTIDLERGELSFSVRYLAEAWGWSKSRVDRFLDDLRAESMIATRSKIGTPHAHKAGQGQSIITVCNYEKYQTAGNDERDNSGTTSGTTAGQQRDKEEQGNKGTIVEEEANASPSTARARSKKRISGKDWPEIPEWIPMVEWNGFMEMRKRKRGTTPTPRAVELLIANLDRLRTAGNDPGRVLDQSTVKNWIDLYEIKDQTNGNHDRTSGKHGNDRRSSLTRAIDEGIANLGN